MEQHYNENLESIIGNQNLAEAVMRSISSALNCSYVHLIDKKTAEDLFKFSLEAAIRDINEHPRGRLFQRLIEYGPYNPDEPEVLKSDGNTKLSDPECGSCVEFIFSHMINRFKGELAELLALQPCIDLIEKLIAEGKLSSDINLFWGDIIKERFIYHRDVLETSSLWGNYVKGADGLVVEQSSKCNINSEDVLNVKGIIEVKSMKISVNKAYKQIINHIKRLGGGVRLGNVEWPGSKILFPLKEEEFDKLCTIIVTPSDWRLSRKWCFKLRDDISELIYEEPSLPIISTQIREIRNNLWLINLDWSQEALSQAAYEMTYWYMSKVGSYIYSKKKLPKDWQNMSPEEAGYNAIKMMLYYMPLRYLSKRQKRMATSLYNVYSFGYPLGVDSKEMLWPEDLQN